MTDRKFPTISVPEGIPQLYVRAFKILMVEQGLTATAAYSLLIDIAAELPGPDKDDEYDYYWNTYQ